MRDKTGQNTGQGGTRRALSPQLWLTGRPLAIRPGLARLVAAGLSRSGDSFGDRRRQDRFGPVWANCLPLGQLHRVPLRKNLARFVPGDRSAGFPLLQEPFVARSNAPAGRRCYQGLGYRCGRIRCLGHLVCRSAIGFDLLLPQSVRFQVLLVDASAKVHPHLIGQRLLPSLKEAEQFTGAPMRRFVRCRKGINPDLKRGQVKRHRSPLDLLKALAQPVGRTIAVKSLLKFPHPRDGSTTPHRFLKRLAQPTW